MVRAAHSSDPVGMNSGAVLELAECPPYIWQVYLLTLQSVFADIGRVIEIIV